MGSPHLFYASPDSDSYTFRVYLPLPKDVRDISRWSVKNGTIYVEIGKST